MSPLLCIEMHIGRQGAALPDWRVVELSAGLEFIHVYRKL